MRRMDPTISVVMPVRNGAQHLREAVESILSQTHSSFEFIIVDDGSDDESREIVRGYAAHDSRVVLLTQEPQGVAAALNSGLAAARAAYVARMDADDRARASRLERQLAAMKGFPDAVAVGCAVATIDLMGKPNGTTTYPACVGSVEEALKRDIVVCHPAAMMKTETARRAGGYRPVFEGAEDYDLWLRMLRHGPIFNLADTLLDYRVHENQISTLNQSRGRVALFSARYVADRWLATGSEPAFVSASDLAIVAVRDLCGRDTAWCSSNQLRKVLKRVAAADPCLARSAMPLIARVGRKAARELDPMTALACLIDFVRIAALSAVGRHGPR